MTGHINGKSLKEYQQNRRDKYVPEVAVGDLIFEPFESRHKTAVYRIGLYLCDRAFGGSEEGGWHYEYGELRGESPRIFTDENKADAYVRSLQERVDRMYNNMGFRSDLESVCCEGRYKVMVWVDNLPKGFPTHRPHYE